MFASLLSVSHQLKVQHVGSFTLMDFVVRQSKHRRPQGHGTVTITPFSGVSAYWNKQKEKSYSGMSWTRNTLRILVQTIIFMV